MVLPAEYSNALNNTLKWQQMPGFPGHGYLMQVTCELLGNFTVRNFVTYTAQPNTDKNKQNHNNYTKADKE